MKSERFHAQFGAFFKEKRRARGLSLREFCRQNGLDPGNMSKIERGVLPPPDAREKLLEYARMLGIREGTDDWLTFFDLAAACRGRIPDELLEDERIVQALPLVFRRLRREELTDDELDRLTKLLEGAWRSEPANR